MPNIKIVFSPFKVGNLFSVKGSVPKYLRSFVVYRFTCPGCNASYKELYNAECFEIIDSTTSSYRLKLKEEMHITWEKPSLNKQVKHVSISITI